MAKLTDLLGGIALLGAVATTDSVAKEYDVYDHMHTELSPRNSSRSRRPDTRYIVLHTTEGGDQGSLDRIKKYGLANYVVLTNGEVYRTIDHGRVAKHAGVSMWDGTTDLSEHSVGIEIVGYHDRALTRAQVQALGGLVPELQRIYGISDDEVLTHSMVAYGKPNRWHNRSHRGRKRCAMLLGTEDVRERIGLSDKPDFDPDVRAGRLVVADNYLEDVLWGDSPRGTASRDESCRDTLTSECSPWSIARDEYNSPRTRYRFPNGTESFGNEITDWTNLPPGTKVELDVNGERSTVAYLDGLRTIGPGESAFAVAGSAYKDPSTIYFLNGPKWVRTGEEIDQGRVPSVNWSNLQQGTQVLVGYTLGGKVSPGRPVGRITPNWDSEDTFYRLPDGSFKTGDQIDPTTIPSGTTVLFQSGRY